MLHCIARQVFVENRPADQAGWLIMSGDLEIYLRGVLEECDAAALGNIRAGGGGPFAACLLMHDRGTGEWQKIAGPCGNAVLLTGLPTAHAEDQVIAPQNQEKLRTWLHACGAARAHVWVVCNGEPCPACRAKLEILARQLRAEGLLHPGFFTVAYGASYEDTCDVAGFDDGAYHRDFLKPPGTGMIRQKFVAWESLPEEVAVQLQPGGAVVAADGRVIAGEGPMPEISAIQNLCRIRHDVGEPMPWDLRRATLYTHARSIGPRAYAEAQWANVAVWASVGDAVEESAEAPGINNAALFSIIATRPYMHPDSALGFVQLSPFQNKAQKEWRRMMESGAAQPYNGIKN